jgi:hypothetical protein
VVTLPADRDIEGFLAAVREMPAVRYVEPEVWRISS